MGWPRLAQLSATLPIPEAAAAADRTKSAPASARGRLVPESEFRGLPAAQARQAWPELARPAPAVDARDARERVATAPVPPRPLSVSRWRRREEPPPRSGPKVSRPSLLFVDAPAPARPLPRWWARREPALRQPPALWSPRRYRPPRAAGLPAPHRRRASSNAFSCRRRPARARGPESRWA